MEWISVNDRLPKEYSIDVHDSVYKYYEKQMQSHTLLVCVLQEDGIKHFALDKTTNGMFTIDIRAKYGEYMLKKYGVWLPGSWREKVTHWMEIESPIELEMNK